MSTDGKSPLLIIYPSFPLLGDQITRPSRIGKGLSLPVLPIGRQHVSPVTVLSSFRLSQSLLLLIHLPCSWSSISSSSADTFSFAFTFSPLVALPPCLHACLPSHPHGGWCCCIRFAQWRLRVRLPRPARHHPRLEP